MCFCVKNAPKCIKKNGKVPRTPRNGCPGRSGGRLVLPGRTFLCFCVNNTPKCIKIHGKVPKTPRNGCPGRSGGRLVWGRKKVRRTTQPAKFIAAMVSRNVPGGGGTQICRGQAPGERTLRLRRALWASNTWREDEGVGIHCRPPTEQGEPGGAAGDRQPGGLGDGLEAFQDVLEKFFPNSAGRPGMMCYGHVGSTKVLSGLSAAFCENSSRTSWQPCRMSWHTSFQARVHFDLLQRLICVCTQKLRKRSLVKSITFSPLCAASRRAGTLRAKSAPYTGCTAGPGGGPPDRLRGLRRSHCLAPTLRSGPSWR